MTRQQFYEQLQQEPPETIDLGGIVLANENKNKWHVCKKGAAYVTHACGSGGPTDPTQSTPTGGDWHKRRFEEGTELMEPAEVLEKDRVCGNCKSILKNEFDLERIVVAVPTEGPIDEAMRRANERIVEEVERKT